MSSRYAKAAFEALQKLETSTDKKAARQAALNSNGRALIKEVPVGQNRNYMAKNIGRQIDRAS